MWREGQLVAVVAATAIMAAARPALANDSIAVDSVRAEINQFLSRELAAHINVVQSLTPPPDRVFGALTTGEYTWGTFSRAIGAYAQMSEQQTLGGRDLAALAGQIGLVEHRLKSTRFSQLY